MIRNITGKN